MERNHEKFFISNGITLPFDEIDRAIKIDVPNLLFPSVLHYCESLGDGSSSCQLRPSIGYFFNERSKASAIIDLKI